MPLILRRGGEVFGLIGESYVDNLMNGEAVEAMGNGRSHCGRFDPRQLMAKLFKFDGLKKDVRDSLEGVKGDVLKGAQREYAVLRTSSIEIR